jgi:hypothetical protein
MLQRVYDLDERSGTTLATESGHNIWNLERQEPLQGSIKRVAKHRLR